MSDETQDRDVLYRIGVEAHPRTRSVLERLAQQSNATQATMTEAAKAVGDETIKQIKRIVSARDDALKTSRATAMVSGPTATEAKRKAAGVSNVGAPAAVAPTATQQAIDRRSPPQQPAVTGRTPEPRTTAPQQPAVTGRTPEPRTTAPQQPTAALPPTSRATPVVSGPAPIDYGPEAKSARDAADAHDVLDRARRGDIESARAATDASAKLTGSLQKEARAAGAAAKARSKLAEAKRKTTVPTDAGVPAKSTGKGVDRFKAAEREKTAATKSGATARVAAEKGAADQDAAIQAKRVEFLKKAEKARLVALKRTHEISAKAAMEEAQRRQAVLAKASKTVAAMREKEARQQAQAADLDRMRRQQAALEQASELETAKARHEQLTQAAKGYKMQAIEAFSSGAESLMRLSRGAVAMGLASEESTEKLLRGLVKMQAFFDLGVGAVNLVARISRGYDTVFKLLETRRAASAASATLAAKQAQAEAAALTQEATAANAAAGAHGRLNAQRAGGLAGAGGVMPTGGKIPFANRRLMGMRMGGSPVAVGAAGLAAVGGVAAATKAIMQLGGPDRGTGKGSIASWEVENIGRPLEKATRWLGQGAQEAGEALSGLGPLMLAYEKAIGRNQAETESTVKILRRLNDSYALHDRLVGQKVTEARKDETAAAEAQAERQRTGLGYKFIQDRQRLGSLTSKESADRSRGQLMERMEYQARELQKQQVRMARLRYDTPENAREAERQKPFIRDAMQSARQELIRLGEERIRTEQRISAESKARAQQTVEALKSQLQLTQDRIKTERDAYLSGKERFGRMSGDEQREVLGLKRKADEAGFRSLGVDQQIRMSQLRGFQQSGRIGAREAAELERLEARAQQGAARALTRKEQDKLASVGTRDVRAISRFGAYQRADAAHYDETFGRGSAEQRRLTLERTTQRRLEIELKDKRDFIVKLDTNTEETARRISNQVRVMMDRNNQDLLKNVERDLARSLDQVNRKVDDHIASHQN